MTTMYLTDLVRNKDYIAEIRKTRPDLAEAMDEGADIIIGEMELRQVKDFEIEE